MFDNLLLCLANGCFSTSAGLTEGRMGHCGVVAGARRVVITMITMILIVITKINNNHNNSNNQHSNDNDNNNNDNNNDNDTV